MEGKFGSAKCSCIRREKGGRKSVEQTECRVCVERINGGGEDEREVEGEEGGGEQRSRHQYSSLVLCFQPRQMRANIREEVDQLKTHQPLPLSALFPFLHFSPSHSPHYLPPFQKSKNLIAAVAHTARTFANITRTHVYHK